MNRLIPLVTIYLILPTWKCFFRIQNDLYIASGPFCSDNFQHFLKMHGLLHLKLRFLITFLGLIDWKWPRITPKDNSWMTSQKSISNDEDSSRLKKACVKGIITWRLSCDHVTLSSGLRLTISRTNAQKCAISQRVRNLECCQTTFYIVFIF